MENIFLNGSILGLRKAEIKKKLDEIIDFAGVEKFIETPLKHYSSGMQLRLAFAVAAHLEPEILIIDEVLAVGDAEFQKKSLGKMEDVTKQGRTVIFVSHNMAAVQNLCSRGVLLESGKMLMQSEMQNVIANYLKSNSTNLNIQDKLKIKNRSGNQKIIFSSFHIENEKGERIEQAINGKDLYFVFGTYCKLPKSVSNVDIGFSIHLRNELTITVNYSSYYKKTFNNLKENSTFRFKINNFPLNKGIYKLGARMLENGIEADWPRDGLAEIEVVDGDFYKSGNSGFENSHLLLSGVWE
jgi:lipopolysaccharide transport system ATP-binding protein